MNYLNISIVTYISLLMFETQKNLFSKGDLDFKWQFSQIPKIFILYFFRQMPSVQSWLYFDYQADELSTLKITFIRHLQRL